MYSGMGWAYKYYYEGLKDTDTYTQLLNSKKSMKKDPKYKVQEQKEIVYLEDEDV